MAMRRNTTALTPSMCQTPIEPSETTGNRFDLGDLGRPNVQRDFLQSGDLLRVCIDGNGQPYFEQVSALQIVRQEKLKSKANKKIAQLIKSSAEDQPQSKAILPSPVCNMTANVIQAQPQESQGVSSDQTLSAENIEAQVDEFQNPKPSGKYSRAQATAIASMLLKQQKRTHNTKTIEQEAGLLQEWKENQYFPKTRIALVAARLGLTVRQVYKWTWDRNKGYVAEKELARKIMTI